MVEKEVTTASATEPTTRHPIRDTTMLIFTGLFLLLAQSAYWLNHTVFDKQEFTSIVTPVVQSESTRNAIATTITEQAFADRPLANQLIGQNVTALIAGLLSTDVAQQLTAGLINRSYTYLTTNNPEPIAIDLTAIKAPLEKITEVIESRGNDVRINPQNIPDKIVLFNPASLPDIYSYSVLMLWLGPLFWIGFIILAALYIYMGRHQYARRVYTLGGTLIVASCIGLLVGPLITPPITAQVQLAEFRGVVDQLITSLLAPFGSQNQFVIVATVIILVIFFSRFAIVRGAKWTVAKTADMTSKSKPTNLSKK